MNRFRIKIITAYKDASIADASIADLFLLFICAFNFISDVRLITEL